MGTPAKIHIDDHVSIPLDEVTFDAVRAQGSGGQNVNKVSSAVHLRFNIEASSLPQAFKRRLRAAPDRRISTDGVVIIKAQRQRTQDQNRKEALARLIDLIRRHTAVPKTRKPTRPTRASIVRRVDEKKKHGRLKRLRAGHID